MKKWCRLLLSMVLLFLSCTAFAAGYDQTSPAATMQSFILAMLRNDSRAFYHLTKDVIPLSYFETDLLEFSNREMSGSKFSDYYYYEFEENTFVLYNSLKTPSPQIEDFFCMQLVRADGEYYISDLYLPHHSRGLYSSLWDERCNQAIQTEGKCLAYVKMAADAGKKTDIKGNTDGFELSGTILVKYTGNSSSVIIPDGITGIYDYAFAQNDTINSVIIPDSVTAIGEFSFYNCTSLENIQFSSSIKSIAASAFYGCVSIREIALPEGIDCISGSLFRGCKSLEDVVIPPSVKTIESNAFSGCHMLDYLTIPESVTYINNNAFDSGFGLNLRVVAGSRAERFARDYWFDYEYYTPDENTVKLVPSFEPVYEDYFDYDLSSRQSAAESYMWAMLNGDSAALKELAKDIIPWYYLESDLLKHGTNIMTGSKMSDFCYFELADNTIIVYDKRVTPSPDVIDFYCMDFVEANGLYYISELHLPKYSRGIYESKWNERCKTIIESGRVLTNNTNEINSVSSLTGAAIVSSSSCQETQNHILGELQGSIEPTCTSPGQTGSILCILCGDQIQLSEVIPATGHIPSELQNAIKPTCTIPGQTGSILCTLCGNQIQSNETIPATGHNLGEYHNSAAASCIREGYTGDAQCSLCNEIVPGNIIPKTAHLLVNNICSICNAQVYEVNGFQPMKVSIALDDADRIVSIDVIKHSETPGFGASLIEAGFDELIGQHISSAEFDAVSGATHTSNGINHALKAAAASVAPAIQEGDKANAKAEVYEVNGFQPMKVSIALDDADRIVSIDVIKHSETPGFGASLIEAGFDELIGQHISSAEFDAVSGATHTSNGINHALKAAAASVAPAMQEGDKTNVKAEVYEVNGFQPMKVSIALDDAGRIVSIDVIKHSETPGFGASLIEAGFDELIGQHISSVEFDAVSGATFTSKGINEALKRAASKY